MGFRSQENVVTTVRPQMALHARYLTHTLANPEGKPIGGLAWSLHLRHVFRRCSVRNHKATQNSCETCIEGQCRIQSNVLHSTSTFMPPLATLTEPFLFLVCCLITCTKPTTFLKAPQSLRVTTHFSVLQNSKETLWLPESLQI